MAKKLYVIKKGFDPSTEKNIENKIVHTWDECSSYVKGVPGAIYKGFDTMEEAEAYMNNEQVVNHNAIETKKDVLYCFTDGSYDPATGRYSYGFVAVKNNAVQYIDAGAAPDDSLRALRQIAGELIAPIKAVQYALEQGEKEVVIVHDYAGVANHINKTWRCKDESSKQYFSDMNNLINQGISVSFEKVDGHSGIIFNELADVFCKNVLDIKLTTAVKKWLAENKLTDPWASPRG